MRSRTKSAPAVSEEDFLLMCDAQTSGGLLVSLPAGQAEAYAARVRQLGGRAAAVVGSVLPGADTPLEIV
jgi:selenide,water dikinase